MESPRSRHSTARTTSRPSPREAPRASTISMRRSGYFSSSMFAPMWAELQEPLMPEDMHTNTTSSPSFSQGSKNSIYFWGEIWEVVTSTPSRMRA